jgi:hypothetical protein
MMLTRPGVNACFEGHQAADAQLPTAVCLGGLRLDRALLFVQAERQLKIAFQASMSSG